MIICRTPFRISFFGGGTDYPAWYRKHGGAVLATTIDKYCYLTCRVLPPFFEHRYRVVYSQIEHCDDIGEIRHPSVREVMRYVGVDRGLEIHHHGDLPARSGMGSSSAFTVGLLHALNGLYGRMPSKKQLAAESIHIEQDILKEIVGSQDQVLAAYGGFNHISFLPQGEPSVRPVTISATRVRDLNAHLMLFFTGINRIAAGVATSYVSDIESKKRELRILRDMVEEALTIVGGDGDLKAFGELLHEAWQVKRGLSAAVSNERIDGLYDEARKAGAVGGKITGAGGGGFLLLFAPPDAHARLREKFGDLIHVPFGFSFSGSQVIFHDPETDYLDEEQARQDHPVAPFQDLAQEMEDRQLVA